MVRVLFDHNMPPSISRALHEIIKLDGHSAYAFREKFPIDTPDVDYFTELGENGDWIVISKDTANAKKRAEREAIMKSGVLAFYLRPAVQKQPIHQQAATIVWQWDKILQQRHLNERGLFELPVNKGSKFRAL